MWSKKLCNLMNINELKITMKENESFPHYKICHNKRQDEKYYKRENENKQ